MRQASTPLPQSEEMLPYGGSLNAQLYGHLPHFKLATGLLAMRHRPDPRWSLPIVAR
jgi:hypothetical protein